MESQVEHSVWAEHTHMDVLLCVYRHWSPDYVTQTFSSLPG